MRNRALNSILLPAATAILFLVVWQVGVRFLSVPAYLIPTPLAVLGMLWTGLAGGNLWPDIGATVSAIAVGYVVGCALAFVAASVVGEFPLLDRALYPLIVAFQSVPKVALAPVIVVWFGFDLGSKVVLIALICFFPCFVNTVIGLKSCPPDLIDLYRAFGASRNQIFWSIKLPSALDVDLRRARNQRRARAAGRGRGGVRFVAARPRARHPSRERRFQRRADVRVAS